MAASEHLLVEICASLILMTREMERIEHAFTYTEWTRSLVRLDSTSDYDPLKTCYVH